MFTHDRLQHNNTISGRSSGLGTGGHFFLAKQYTEVPTLDCREPAHCSGRVILHDEAEAMMPSTLTESVGVAAGAVAGQRAGCPGRSRNSKEALARSKARDAAEARVSRGGGGARVVRVWERALEKGRRARAVWVVFILQQWRADKEDSGAKTGLTRATEPV